MVLPLRGSIQKLYVNQRKLPSRFRGLQKKGRKDQQKQFPSLSTPNSMSKVCDTELPASKETENLITGTIYELAAVVEHVDGETIVTGKFITFVTNYPRFCSSS